MPAAHRRAYPHLRIVGDLVFVSGTSARQPDGEIKGASVADDGRVTLDIRAQTQAVLESIAALLADVDLSLGDLVDVTTFLVSMDDFDGYNDVYAEFFSSESGPTRTTVAVHQLPHPHLAVEIKAVARGGKGAEMITPIDLDGWIEEHREQLNLPSNAQIWDEGDFIITVVGGPNQRTDFHDDPCDEFFYQLRGDMVLRIWEDGGPRDVPIREGSVLLLPAHVRHSPQRPVPGSVGLVIERPRPVGEVDGFEWYCPRCGSLVHRSECSS